MITWSWSWQAAPQTQRWCRPRRTPPHGSLPPASIERTWEKTLKWFHQQSASSHDADEVEGPGDHHDARGPLLPDHPPEVRHGGLGGALGHDVRLGLDQALNKKLLGVPNVIFCITLILRQRMMHWCNLNPRYQPLAQEQRDWNHLKQ